MMEDEDLDLSYLGFDKEDRKNVFCIYCRSWKDKEHICKKEGEGKV